MAEKKFKTKDMIIAVFLTLLAVLCIVFYFLPAFNVKHRASPSADYDIVNYSAWEMTKAVFTNTKYIGSNLEGLLYIKDTYGFVVILSGILMPLSIICTICTAVFAYLSWLKTDDFKKFCFLFSLCGMMFATITLISTWFIAIQIKDGNNFNFFNCNLKGSMSYASFVSLILAFVVAIIACAYNYFLDNFDDEEEEDEEEVVVKKVKVVVVEEEKEETEEVKSVPKPAPNTATKSTSKTTTKKPSTKTASKPATKSTAKKTTTSTKKTPTTKSVAK